MTFLSTAKNLAGRIVLVRGSLNIPLTADGRVADDFRLRKLFLTLDFLIKQKARVVLIGHLGRNSENSLESVYEYLLKNRPWKTEVSFDKDTFKNFTTWKVEKIKEEIAEMKDGNILLLDNLRQNEGERKNSDDFKEKIRSLGEIYVQDAFSVSHRQHASMTIEPDYYGLQYEQEVKNLSKVLEPESPSIFILGGAKIKTKLPLLEKALEKYDKVIVGGALANTFYKFLGYDIKNSLVEEVGEEILEKIVKQKNFVLPDFEMTIWSGDRILDISPKFFKKLKKDFKSAKFIFFNGPVGLYERGFTQGTEKVIKLSASKKNFFLVGGGDTAAAVFKLRLEKKADFISTGGGALINFLTK